MSVTPLDEQSVPMLATGVTMRFDKRRDRWVILAPERVLMPDEIAVEILKRCQGRSVGAIVDELCATFEAPREVVAHDVLVMLQDLHDKGVLSS